MNITVIGAGYVGLITASGLAETGHRVICVDDDQGKVDTLNAGGMPFYEPGLGDLVKRNREAGRLEFISRIEDALAQCEVDLYLRGHSAPREWRGGPFLGGTGGAENFEQAHEATTW